MRLICLFGCHFDRRTIIWKNSGKICKILRSSLSSNTSQGIFFLNQKEVVTFELAEALLPLIDVPKEQVGYSCWMLLVGFTRWVTVEFIPPGGGQDGILGWIAWCLKKLRLQRANLSGCPIPNYVWNFHQPKLEGRWSHFWIILICFGSWNSPF